MVELPRWSLYKLLTYDGYADVYNAAYHKIYRNYDGYADVYDAAYHKIYRNLVD